MIQLRNIEKRYETKAGFTYDLFKQLNQQGTTIVHDTQRSMGGLWTEVHPIERRLDGEMTL
jgi:hypothetical protein